MSEDQQGHPSSVSSVNELPAYTGMPGWVKWFVVGAVVLVIVLLAGLLLGSGEHGPGRHMSHGLSPDVHVLAVSQP
ncbi:MULTISPECIES: hypothetical protein [Nocardioides]|uniref:Uncharacterized protein n=1 Tax=Nocardioides piscis TaxID=2714938 RepID=A0A6G7YBP3_9ACTN|nr:MULTISPECIES: hypothetical protein [Nocardioides]QIK74058.1 hypothetical protein G7071_10285 [Nocardioides piscis]